MALERYLVAAEVMAELHSGSTILAVGDVGLLEALHAKSLDIVGFDDVDRATAVIMGGILISISIGSASCVAPSGTGPSSSRPTMTPGCRSRVGSSREPARW